MKWRAKRRTMRLATIFEFPRRSARRNAGYSLIECLTVVGLISFVLGAIAVTLHGLHRAELRTRVDLDQQRAIDRLAEQFRADGHGAASAELQNVEASGHARQLRFVHATSTSIEYAVSEHEIQRTVRDADMAVHRETFPFTDWPNTRFEMDRTQSIPLVTLFVSIPDATLHQGRLVPIQAAVGNSAE